MGTAFAISAVGLSAQNFAIKEFSVDQAGLIRLRNESDPSFYYVLYRGDQVTALIFARDIAFGQAGTLEFNDRTEGKPTGFFRVQRVPVSSPVDTDRDGIDDVYELRHAGILHPINPTDAAQDPDRDGVSNLDEYKRGTDPGTSETFFGIVKPDANSTFLAPVDVPVTVVGDASVQRVELFANDSLLGQSTTVPFNFTWQNVPPGEYTLTAKSFRAGGQTQLSAPVSVTVNIPPPQVDANPPAIGDDSVELTGTALAGTTVQVVGGRSVVSAVVGANGKFAVGVPLRPNRLNRLFVSAIAASGRGSPQTPAEIIQDSQPPQVFVDFPPANTLLTSDTTVIAGRVGDVLSGFMGLTVSIDGQPANVIVGIGPNGTFERSNVPLALGPNKFVVTATDEHGNSVSKEVTYTRVDLSGATMEIVSGNLQTARIGTVLPEPLVVRVLGVNGQPLANKLVTFEVIRSNGRLKATKDEPGEGTPMFQMTTDANGRASVFWQLGSDAGCGNNRLAVKSKDVVSTTFFCASAEPQVPKQINIGSGNNQRVEAGGPSFEPLKVWVSDACNGVVNVPVTFRVLEGGGKVNGQSQVTVNTSITGHAEVDFMLGPVAGNNVIEANFPNNPTGAARFVLTGINRAARQETAFSGVVLNNSEQPVGGAQCVITIDGQRVAETVSDDLGRFRFTGIPAGVGMLFVDGLPATRLNGQPIPQGSFPFLMYEILVVPNAENSLSVPVLLPRLNPNNARLYDGTRDVTLTCEGIAGLKMVVKAGSMRLPDGTRPTTSKPAILSLNQVHADDVPMPMPDGASPPFAWTLQPAMATFDPPVRIEYPNMSGLPAGAIAYFLSFNHETERFEIVASGHVLPDGATIVTDPGAGLSVAGWGCNCPPYSVTGSCGGCN
jgi:hypothetical protein